jgi:two-component system NtrC family sensor kinase
MNVESARQSAPTPESEVKFTHTIAFKLFLVTVTVQTLILAALTFASIRVQQSSLMETVTQSAARVSDLIARSTRHSMMLNQKEEVQQIISALGGEPGIAGLRIYNKQGVVTFGTNPAELMTKVDMNAEACVVCHTYGLENPHTSSTTLTRIFTNAAGDRVLGLITPIRNAPQCSDAACHAHQASKTILGVLDVKMSLAQVDHGLAEHTAQLVILSVAAILLIGLVSGAFIWMFVRRPVKRLAVGIEMVTSGHLDHRLDARGSDELGRLAQSFNSMTEELSRARQENAAWSQTLEAKVRQKTADLEEAHKQMVRVEKMASLGNLASSVAHELNNPLEGILTFARLLIKRIRKAPLAQDQIDSYSDDLRLVADEAQRCGNIVKNLLVFARQGGMALQPTRIRTVVGRCTLLVNHYAEMNSVKVTTSCTDDDEVECDAGQIQQVLIALMMNAVEAMTGPAVPEGGGILTVDVRREGDKLVFKVVDNGMGMNDDVKAHIFEPFFTTKSEGKGVGLGLAIAYGIIERHHGTIEVESSVGRGTTFTVTLPVVQPSEQTKHLQEKTSEGART